MAYTPLNPIENTNPSAVPFTIKGAAGQSVDLQDWTNNSGSILGSISNTGTATFQTVSAANYLGWPIILEGNNSSTGVYDFAGATLNPIAPATKIDISPVKGWIVNNTGVYATNPSITNVNFTGVSGVSLSATITTADATYFLINSASQIYTQIAHPTPQDRRDNISLFKVAHPNRSTILNINNTVDYDTSPMAALRDMFIPISLINDGITCYPDGANLKFNVSSGQLYGMGINWTSNQKNPNSVTVSAKLSASFYYRTLLGGNTGLVSNIDPTVYDLNGVITPLPTPPPGRRDDAATNQRIYMYPTGVVNIQYGQQVYSSIATAIASQQTETFIKAPNAIGSAILLGILAVRRGATNLQLTTDGIFTPASILGESVGGVNGISTTTLEQAYNNSSSPEIITSDSLGPLSLKSGATAGDSADVFETINSSLAQTSKITGAGNAVFSSVSAANYYNVTQKLNNRYYIGTKGDFQSLSSAMTWLSANMTADTELLLDTGTYNIADTISINLPHRLLINGLYYEGSVLQAYTGLTNKPMFNVTTDVCFDKLTFLGSTLTNYGKISTENCVNFTGNTYHELTRFNMDTFNTGIHVTGNTGSIYVFDSYVQNCYDSGIKMDSSGANALDVEVASFVGCNSGITLQKGVSAMFHVMGNIFENLSGGTCFTYVPSAYSYTDSPCIINNVWNNTGQFYTGFDFTLSAGRDADIYMRNNAGKEDKRSHFKVNVVDNLTTTTATNANTYYKANFTNGLSYACKYLLENNKYTYLTKNVTDMVVWVNGAIQVNQNNRNINIALRKNGSLAAGLSAISPITIRIATSNQPYPFGFVAYLEDMAKGDFIELFVSSPNGGDVITLQDLTMFGQGQ